jgi:hypothetical protein
VAGTANFIYAFPVTFDRAGTITALGQHIGQNTGKVFMGVYDTDPSTPQTPRTLLFSVEKTAPGFNQPVTSTGLTIQVTAGQTIWFAAVYDNNGVAGGCINIPPNAIVTQWGTDWDGVTGGAPTIAGFAGYRHAQAYGALPSSFPGGATTLKSNGANAPSLMFKFTPS